MFLERRLSAHRSSLRWKVAGRRGILTLVPRSDATIFPALPSEEGLPTRYTTVAWHATRVYGLHQDGNPFTQLMTCRDPFNRVQKIVFVL